MDEIYWEKLSDDRWKEKRKEVLRRDNCQCRMCGASDIELEVHHRFYIYGADPWKYDRDSLITLCSKCHSLIHRTISPLIYLKREESLFSMNFTPCHRCNGLGLLKEYHYVQGGICFRCKGNRYEELIDPKSTKNLFDGSLDSENNFDLISYILDENSCRYNFGLAKRYQFGLDGEEFNLEKARHYYTLSALNGYPEAQNNLGILLKYSSKSHKAFNTSLRWFIYGAMQGLFPSIKNVRDLLEDSRFISNFCKDHLIKEWTELGEKRYSEDDNLDRVLDFAYIIQHSNEEALRLYLISSGFITNANTIPSIKGE